MKVFHLIRRCRPNGLVVWAGPLLVLFATSAEAAALVSEPGFWAGMADGFLALLKLLISPVAAVSIVDPAAAGWHYDAGYYVGVLTFAAAAGMAASAPDSEQAQVVQ